MAAPTNTFLTTAAIGNREDLTDAIYNIAPTDTPFFNLCAKSKATATLHEWQTQDLAAAANNAQLEGDDATANATTPTVRLGNRTQISSKTAIVSGTQETVDKAGRTSEMAYQMALKAKELKRDIEFALTQNNVTAASPRQSRGLVGWVDSANVNGGAGYVAPNYVTNVAQTDGTPRAFTEVQLKDVLQKVFTSGGNPDVIMMGPAAKQTFSAFSGNSTRFDKGEDKSLTASVDVYISDFGTLRAVPNRFQRARDVFVLESEKWAIAWERPITQWELAKTGDSIKRQILGEWTLEARNPKANGAVVDVS